jgi:hypothetical protein
MYGMYRVMSKRPLLHAGASNERYVQCNDYTPRLKAVADISYMHETDYRQYKQYAVR